MAEYFSCMACNGVTEITASPPTCPRCGCDAGIVTPYIPERRKETRKPQGNPAANGGSSWRRGKLER